MKRKHKTLQSAKRELRKLNDNFTNKKIRKVKGATIWKYWIGSDLEWLNKQ